MHKRSVTPEKTSGSSMAAANAFGRFGKEKHQPVRTPEVIEDEVLRKLINAFTSFNFFTMENFVNAPKSGERPYANILNHIKGIEYTAKDVEKFSVALVGLQDERCFEEKAGFFLSVLINNGKDDTYVIHTSYLDKEINYLGFLNTKNLTVNGNVGCSCGKFMLRGSITVNGNCGERTGFIMYRGKISINGSGPSVPFYEAGYGAEGGQLYINGFLIVDKPDLDLRGIRRDILRESSSDRRDGLLLRLIEEALA